MNRVGCRQVFRRRWLVLGSFCFLSLLNGFQWVQYAIVSDAVAKYYGVSLQAVDWASMVFMLMYVPFVVPASWLLDKKVQTAAHCLQSRGLPPLVTTSSCRRASATPWCSRPCSTAWRRGSRWRPGGPTCSPSPWPARRWRPSRRPSSSPSPPGWRRCGSARARWLRPAPSESSGTRSGMAVFS